MIFSVEVVRKIEHPLVDLARLDPYGQRGVPHLAARLVRSRRSMSPSPVPLLDHRTYPGSLLRDGVHVERISGFVALFLPAEGQLSLSSQFEFGPLPGPGGGGRPGVEQDVAGVLLVLVPGRKFGRGRRRVDEAGQARHGPIIRRGALYAVVQSEGPGVSGVDRVPEYLGRPSSVIVVIEGEESTRPLDEIGRLLDVGGTRIGRQRCHPPSLVGRPFVDQGPFGALEPSHSVRIVAVGRERLLGEARGISVVEQKVSEEIFSLLGGRNGEGMVRGDGRFAARERCRRRRGRSLLLLLRCLLRLRCFGLAKGQGRGGRRRR
mmetsp:Transcript_4159/g.11467  ORF Transcript_4159/g.11467 Transcript_4159/m.11467 type:complete len:320 (-) Transcript_4159:648-1607(-)